MHPDEILTPDEAVLLRKLRREAKLCQALIAWLRGDRTPLLVLCSVPCSLAENKKRLTEIPPAIRSE